MGISEKIKIDDDYANDELCFGYTILKRCTCIEGDEHQRQAWMHRLFRRSNTFGKDEFNVLRMLIVQPKKRPDRTCLKPLPLRTIHLYSIVYISPPSILLLQRMVIRGPQPVTLMAADHQF